MSKRMKLFVTILMLISTGAAHAEQAGQNLKMKQTKKVHAVTLSAAQSRSRQALRIASGLAEQLDEKAGVILKFESLSWWRKFLDHVDENKLKAEYADELMQHMTRMTEFFYTHRKQGPFAKFSELEFRNLLLKSDYLLTLAISRQCLEVARHNESFKRGFDTVLAAYNTERMAFDQKMVRFAFAIN